MDIGELVPDADRYKCVSPKEALDAELLWHRMFQPSPDDPLNFEATVERTLLDWRLCRIERRPPRLDLKIYPYLPQATVATTTAKDYLSLLAGAAS